MLSTAALPLAAITLQFPHLQQQNPTTQRIRIGPQARPPLLVVFLDERPPVSDPSPSLINWMATRHSAPLVSYEQNQTKTTKRKEGKKQKPHIPSPLLRRSDDPGTTPSRPRLVFRSSAGQHMLQHASIALVETECNAGSGMAGFLQQSTCMCPPVAATRSIWPSAIWPFWLRASCPSAGIVASDAPNFPDPH